MQIVIIIILKVLFIMAFVYREGTVRTPYPMLRASVLYASIRNGQVSLSRWSLTSPTEHHNQVDVLAVLRSLLHLYCPVPQARIWCIARRVRLSHLYQERSAPLLKEEFKSSMISKAHVRYTPS